MAPTVPQLTASIRAVRAELSRDIEAITVQDCFACITKHKSYQGLRGGSVLGPGEDHASLLETRIGVYRYLPIAAFFLQGRGKRQRMGDDADVGRTALDELGRLHNAVPVHELSLYFLVDPERLHGPLRRPPIR